MGKEGKQVNTGENIRKHGKTWEYWEERKKTGENIGNRGIQGKRRKTWESIGKQGNIGKIIWEHGKTGGNKRKQENMGRHIKTRRYMGKHRNTRETRGKQ